MNRFISTLLFLILSALSSISYSQIGVFSSSNKFVQGLTTTQNLHILSIGIDITESEMLADLRYAKSDAILIDEITREHFKNRYLRMRRDTLLEYNGEINSHILLDKDANISNIMAAVEDIVQKAKPEDFFIFYFGGFTFKWMNEDNIHFILHNYNFQRGVPDDNPDNFFTLYQLKDWLEQIQAKQQMIITEAGDSETFSESLVKIMINDSPLEAILSDRNRVVLTTNGLGLELPSIKSGLLTYFISQLEESTLFDFFIDDRRRQVRYELTKQDFESEISRPNYTSIFCQKDINKYLKYFADKISTGKSRGTDPFTSNEPKEDTPIPEVTNYALIIGTDPYEASTWGPLDNPINDARTIKEELENRYGFETIFLQDPTKEEIVLELYRLGTQEKFAEESQLFIFIAGHGGFDDFVNGFIVTKDSKDKSIDPTRESYIKHSSLRDMVNNIPSKHILLVLDVCFGGTFDDRLGSSGTRSESDYEDIYDHEYVTRKLQYQTRLYITSGGKEYVPDGDDGKHSPFARKFIEALRTGDEGDGILTYKEILTYIDRVSPEPRAGEFMDNEPGSDFLFIAK
jgi:hypothetical protein